MNKITIEWSKEDRKLLEDLMGAVTLLTSVIGSTQPAPVQKQIIEEVTEGVTSIPIDTTSFKVVTEVVADPVEETPAPVAESAPEVKPVSLAEFQKAVTLAVSKGAEAKKAAKEIINKYAASVSTVPEDKRAEVMAELERI